MELNTTNFEPNLKMSIFSKQQPYGIVMQLASRGRIHAQPSLKFKSVRALNLMHASKVKDRTIVRENGNLRYSTISCTVWAPGNGTTCYVIAEEIYYCFECISRTRTKRDC